MVAFSSVPTIEVRLPSGSDSQSLVHIVGMIRDTLDCVTELNLSSVVVISDSKDITDLIDRLQSSNSSITTHPLIRVLSSGNQNKISQVISSLSQEFNKINNQTVENAIASEKIQNNPFFHHISCLDGISAADIFVTPLDSLSSQLVSEFSLSVWLN